MIVGQTPGITALETELSWYDPSGDTLRSWLNVSRDTFYSKYFVLTAMDFYFPGRKHGGDAPPRVDFARKWHPLLRAAMPRLSLTLLVGRYAQQFYLRDQSYHTLTETVAHYSDYLPDFFPLVHPSPRNVGWHQKNLWFHEKLIPELRSEVRRHLPSTV